MPKILRNLLIDRVASVDKGAGEGVEVVLMKREPTVQKKLTFEQDHKGGVRMWHEPDAEEDKKKKKPTKKSMLTKAIDLLKKSVTDAFVVKPEERDAFIEKTFGEFAEDVQPIAAVHDAVDAAFSTDSEDEDDSGINKQEDDMTKEEAEKLQKQLDEMKVSLDAANDELTFEKMKPEHKEFAKAFPADKKKEFSGKSDADKDKQMSDCKKSANEVPEAVQKVLDEAVKKALDLQKEVDLLKSASESTVLAKRVAEIGLPATDLDTLRKARGGDVEAVKKLEDRIASLTKQVSASSLLKEWGSASGAEGNGTAYEQIQSRAAELQKVDAKLSPMQAFDKAFTDPANKDLVAQYRKETNSPSR